MDQQLQIVKAIKNDDGEWLLDVLGVPFGGPHGGKDNDGEFFDSRTNLWLDEIGKRAIVHYHGYDGDGRPTDPEIIGKELDYEVRDDGVWFRVLLDKASETAGRMWTAAQNGLARASSGAISHLVRPLDSWETGGHIEIWPVAEISLMDMGEGYYPANAYAVALPVAKAIFAKANLNLPEGLEPEPAEIKSQQAEPEAVSQSEETPKMEDEKLTIEQVEAFIEKREAAKAESDRIANLEAKAAELEEIKAQIKEANEKPEGYEQVKRLDNPAPAAKSEEADVKVFSKWDGFTVGQLGLAYDMLKAAGQIPSAQLYRALHAKALKSVDSLAENQIRRDDRGNIVREFAPAVNQATIKAVKSINPMQMADNKATKSDELMYSSQSSYGDEWVPALWSPELWDLVRNETKVLSLFRQVEVPGESLTIPTVGGRTTVYKVAQTNDQSELDLSGAAATMTKTGTGQVTLTPNKGMAWIGFSEELNEDSIVPVLSTLQMSLQMDLAEQIDEILISGDTDTATTNISDTGNGSISAAWRLLMVNGLRDYALGNSNASDRGTLAAEDFTAVMALLGTNGAFALDPNKLAWILDPGVYRKALTLGETLTADKAGGVGTFQNGILTRVFGSPVVVSDKYGLTDANGKIHNTSGNNTQGSFLLVRPDRWVVGFGRQIRIEAPARGLTEIVTDTRHLVASFRMDFKNNGEGSALGYNITV